jgi:hypothetical protein
MVDRLHREVEGHELDDRPQPSHRRPGAEAGEAIFGDWGVDDAFRPEFLEKPLSDLVGALVFGDLLAEHEHAIVTAHLLGHRVAQRLADGDARHRRAFGRVGLIARFLGRCDQRAGAGLHLAR